MKTIRLKFVTASGKEHSVSVNYARQGLDTEEGKAAVRKAADAIIEHQPFGMSLAGFNGAELIDRTVVEIV